MTWWQVLLIVLGVIVVVIGMAATLMARSLDRIHKNVMKSRLALERALTDRHQAALRVARSGDLDVASSILLADMATEAVEVSVFPIVADGLDAISVEDDDGRALPARAEESPDRLTIESELSRAMRHSVDQLAPDVQSPELAALERARVYVQMTRRFHNNHVSQARRVRKNRLVRLLHLAGNAPEPKTVNLDDRRDRD
ncbi:hypothetical protein [Trueperella pecoris]|uniref:hypothetical protein n=1 Tax=Trueperella pecoris TaxID=2733571 RepID=UPI00186B90B6|nr:hypothetical protein [Trueperella pecoris]QOQ38890.1 hypothetical protein HLG82_05140 [Trueperella pecoris]